MKNINRSKRCKGLLFSLLYLFPFLSFAQINYTANTQVLPSDGSLKYGMNMGYYPGWSTEQLGNISAGNPYLGLKGIGVNCSRPALNEDLLETFGYNALVTTFDSFYTRGIKDMTVILGGPSNAHRDPVNYCPGKPSKMFANMYEPIWDGGANGTPINENNYYALYVWKTVNQYKKYVRVWEVLNEPDFDDGTTQQWKTDFDLTYGWWQTNPQPCEYDLKASIFRYNRLLRITWEVVKSVDPTAYVEIGALGYASFLDAVLRNTDNPVDGSVTAAYPLKAGAYFDLMGYHTYPHLDGSLWTFDIQSNQILGYHRNSDGAIDSGVVKKQRFFQNVLDKYGYDGTTYPKKPWIITEFNLPRKAFSSQYIGNDEIQRNSVVKAAITCYQHNIIQFHPFQLGDRTTDAAATYEFDLMGFYNLLDASPPYTMQVHDEGIAYKTVSDLLAPTKYDAARTAQMGLPANIAGGAFKLPNGNYVYALWAKTQQDYSEVASATYSFPASFNLGQLVKYDWGFSYSNNTSSVASQNIALTGSPIFLSSSTIVMPTLPDLALTNPTTTTPSVQQGQTLSWKVDIKNIGQGDATGSFVVKSYLSTDQTLSPDDYQNGSIPTGNFVSGYSVPQAGGSFVVPTTLAAGQYYLILKVDADNQLNETNENNNIVVLPTPITISTNGGQPAGNYCTSTGTAPWQLWVAKVQLNTLNNVSDKAKDYSSLGYSDYTALSTNVTKGQTYPLSITPPTGWNGYFPSVFCRVWIDYNGNKIFEDSEMVLTSTNQTLFTQNITIPTTATTGNVRMRVSMKWGGYPTACETFDSGEVEDYTISIGGSTGGGCVPVVQGTLPANQTLTTSSACATFKWAVPVNTFQSPCGVPNGPWLLPTALPTLPFGRGVNGGVTMDSACFPIGTTVVKYLDFNGVEQSFTVTVTNSGNNTGSYCASTGTTPWQTWISKVQLGTINNTTDKFKDYNTLGYSDYTSLSSTVIKGQSFPLSVSPGLTWAGDAVNMYCRVWIDFNGNKTFEDNEKVMESTNQTIFTTNILIPSTAIVGTVRMRVSMKRGAYPTACEVFNDGEVEDYTINIDNGGIITPFPDLTLANLAIVPVSVQQGGVLNYNVDVKNIGTATATGTFTVKGYISTDNVLSGDDIQTGVLTLSNFTAGFVSPQAGISSIIPATLAVGQYYLILKADADTQISESNESNNTIVSATPFAVTQKGQANAYCASTGTTPWQTWVAKVQLNTINNITDKFKDYNTAGYSDYTSYASNTNISTAVTKGQSYPLSITPGMGWAGDAVNEYGRVWIDFNGNNTFEDNEKVLEATNQLLYTSNILIPTTAITGTVRMRVSVKRGAYPTACETFDGGEVEDYIINIQDGSNNSCTNDTQAPVFTGCPKDTIITLPVGQFNVDYFWSNIAVSDNCGTPTVTSNYTTPLRITDGQQTRIILTAKDAAGNTSNCTWTALASSSVVTQGLKVGITASSLIYSQWSVDTFKVSVQNNSNSNYSNVSVQFNYPANTTNGGAVVPSIGQWSEWCAANVKCYTWTIPSFSAHSMATLSVPLYILNATGAMVGTANILTSTPANSIAANNTATVTVNPLTVLAQVQQQTTQQIPVVIQRISPNPTAGDVTVELESLDAREVQFNFSNTMGETVISQTRAVERGLNRLQFDMWQLPQGVYFITPNTNQAHQVPTKFVKM